MGGTRSKKRGRRRVGERLGGTRSKKRGRRRVGERLREREGIRVVGGE